MSTLILLKWKDSHGHEQRFRLINRVSAQWLKFGYCLRRSTNQLEGWEKQCLLDADRCWCKVMSHWLKEDGTPDYPATWKGVFCLLEDVECLPVAWDLQKALASVIPPPPPPPPLPACTGDNETSDSTLPPPTADSADLINTADITVSTAATHPPPCPCDIEATSLPPPTSLTEDTADVVVIHLDLKTNILYLLLTFAADYLRIRF